MVSISLAAVQALANPAASPTDQVAALKQLKNDVVGHDQRKELVVKHGALRPLVDILHSGSHEEARIQAALILSTFANAGPSLAQPLSKAIGYPGHLLDALSPNTSTRLVTATLQLLRNLAVACANAEESNDVVPQYLFHNFQPFAGSNINVAHAILADRTSSDAAKQAQLVAEIIALTAHYDEHSQSVFTDCRVLETLTPLLMPLDQPRVTVNLIPSVASAISSIIHGSAFRAHRFILCSSVSDMLSGELDEYEYHRAPALPNLNSQSAVTTSFNNGVSRAFPAMGSMQQGRARAYAPPDVDGGDVASVAHRANALISHLLAIVRSCRSPADRLAVLRLVAQVNNVIDDNSQQSRRKQERERQLSMLAVPLAVQLVKQGTDVKAIPTESSIHDPREREESRLVKEQACEVLSLLIEGNKVLQEAAVDAGAIKHICPLLKRTFDNVTPSKPMWSQRSNSAATANQDDPTCQLGSRGLPAEILHAMKVRHGALEAIATLAEKEDLHRKAVVEAGVMSCIIDSLKPFPSNYLAEIAGKPGQMSVKDGNTTPVILAACHAARVLSRSVSLLRTSLIDAGVAKPIYALLSHPDIDIQIAATDCVANIVLEFSPMREDLINEGVVNLLTEHARRSEMGLRLSSLWAFKHLVLAASKEIKCSALDELGTGWLVAAIRGEQQMRDDAQAAQTPLHPVGGGVGLNAAGEQVQLLNPTSNMDVDDDEPADDGDEDLEEDEDGEVMVDEQSGMQYQHSGVRSTLQRPEAQSSSGSVRRYLASLRDMEEDAVLQSRRDDLAVQEQALDVIRNVLNGEDSPYMFDYLMAQIGREHIFSLLTEKLAPLPSSSSSRAGGGVLYNPTEIVSTTIHILNHIAASPRHKQLLVAQTALLQEWLPHFTHADRSVRVICIWAVNSLTWIEDDNDRQACRLRIQALKQVGIDGVVRSLVADPDMDVRERVRTAVRQLDS